jgi:glycosyltransferase involved in cell wall biosynthesis
MSTPNVSIQIPCFQAEKFIEKTISTALAQTYSNLQITVLDDASKDNTYTICNQFKASHLKIYRNEPNLGRVQNYQKAFELSKNSDWFANLDGDDFYINNQWIGEAIDAIQLSKSKDILLYQGSMNKIEQLIPKSIEQIDSFHYVVSGYDYIQHCIKEYAFFHLACLFNTHIAKTISPYIDENLYTDFFTAMRIAAKGNVIISNKNIGIWNQHIQNESAKRFESEEQKKIQNSFYQLFEYLEENFDGNQINLIIKTYENRMEKERVIREFHRSSTISFLLFMLNNHKLIAKYGKWIIKRFIYIKI